MVSTGYFGREVRINEGVRVFAVGKVCSGTGEDMFEGMWSCSSREKYSTTSIEVILKI